MMTFALRKNATPSVAILPTLEAIISVRKGDAPEPVWALWQRIRDFLTLDTPYVFDNCHEAPDLEKATGYHHENIKSALYQACQGPDPKAPIGWSSRMFLDGNHQDHLPQYISGLTLGWTAVPDQPRGLSFKVAVPDEKIDELAGLGLEIAGSWPGLWRWITVGYRFTPVQWYSTLMPEALEIIQGRCKRYIGVDVGDIFGIYTSIWQNCLRSVNWMTFVCDDLLHRVNNTGFKRFDLQFDRLEKGFLFKTGFHPTLCDRNLKEPKGAFTALDHCLSEIRADSGLSFSPMWNVKQTINWLNRFQDDDAFLYGES